MTPGARTHREHLDQRRARGTTSARNMAPGKRTLTENLPQAAGRAPRTSGNASPASAGSDRDQQPAAGPQRAAAPRHHPDAIQRLFGRPEVTQLRAPAPGGRDGAAPEDPAAVQRAAAHGVSGPAEPLPHLSRIQQAFGRHDVSGIRAHVGGAAAEGALQMGAAAYATGHSVAFRESPDLHTAAHEAAHVVQQAGGGVRLKGGVGEVGDAYEQHADAVADLVVQGRSAEALLDQHSGGTAGHSPAGAIQRVIEGHDHLHLHELVAVVETKAGQLTQAERDWLGEVYRNSNNPFLQFASLDAFLEELRERRATLSLTVDETDSETDNETVPLTVSNTTRRKDTSGEIMAMYGSEIASTTTAMVLREMLKNRDSSAGVFLAATVRECNSVEHEDMVLIDHLTITVPDLNRLDAFDDPENGLDKETNCRLIAEHELVHLQHTWNNWRYSLNAVASTNVDEFRPEILPRTIAELQSLIPEEEKHSKGGPGRYIHDRLTYIQTRFEKTGKNNEAPAVMRELRRYLEALAMSRKQEQQYAAIRGRIEEYDDKCHKEVNRRPGETDQGCCVLF